jgi:hypothetical protein
MKRIVILCLAAVLLAVAFPLLLAQPETAAKPEAEGASLALARTRACGPAAPSLACWPHRTSTGPWL